MERLTSQMEKAVCDYLEKIEDLGGAPAAIQAGFMQKEIQDSAYEEQKRIEKHEKLVVGTNAFVAEKTDVNFRLEFPSEEMERKQILALEKLRSSRSNGKVEETLLQLREAARSGANLMPPILAAIRELATLGEISTVLREEFGTYQENALI